MVFLIKKSVAKEILKSLGKNKLEELKQEVIEILKKQDEKEYKKALSQFENEEKNMSYLEKSISGEWIEKAGYGIGTVRVWKGKKYKKIAPGKWARMYEKEGRGTNIAVGHLIAKVKKIDDIEELMNFVMQNKQRFEDTNVLDKIRAAVDEQNEKLSSGTVESKGKSENTVKQNVFNLKENNRYLNFNELIPEYEKQKKILNWNLNSKKKRIENEYDFTDFSEEEKNKFLAPKFEQLENQYTAAKDNLEYIKNALKRATERDGVNNVIEKMKKRGIYEEVMGSSKTSEKKEDLEKYNKEMNKRRTEKQSVEYKEIVDKIPFESDKNKKIFLTGIKAMNISSNMKLDIADWFAKNKINNRSYVDYMIEKVKEGYDKYESSSSSKGALYKGDEGIPCNNKATAYFAQFLAMAKEKGMEELKETEAEKQKNNFSLDDIKSKKTIKTVEEFEDVIRQLATEKNQDNAESKFIDFLGYNLEGGMAGSLYDKIFEKYGDTSYSTLKKQVKGQKISEREKNIGYADEYANKEEEKSKKAKIKKSLEDILFLLNEDEDEEDYNDYSAENPSEFNSIKYKVANAFDECGY